MNKKLLWVLGAFLFVDFLILLGIGYYFFFGTP